MVTPPPNMDNQDFLEVLFGPDWPDVPVVSVRGVKSDTWTSYPAGKILKRISKSHNNYWCVSLFNDPYLRRKEIFKTMRVLALDDVGPLIDPAEARALLGEPTARVMTSPGNEQWSYRLEPPVTDRSRAENLIKRVVNGLCEGVDPGMLGVTRLMRLPVGTNTKEKCGPSGFTGRIMSVDPGRSIDPAGVELAFPLSSDAVDKDPAPLDVDTGVGDPGVDLGDPLDSLVPGQGQAGPAAPSFSPPSSSPPKTDAVLEALRRFGLVQGNLRRASQGQGWDITCPWGHEHSPGASVGTGTFYFQGGGFKCWHGHCENRGPVDLRKRLDEMLREDSGDLVGLDDMGGDKLTAVDPKDVPKSPLGDLSSMAARFFDTLVWMIPDNKFVDIPTRTAMDAMSVDVLWRDRLDADLPRVEGPRGQKRVMPPSQWYLRHPRRRALFGRTWWPGRPDVFTAAGEGQLLNMWRDVERPLREAPQDWLDNLVRSSDWWVLVETLLGPDARRMFFYMSCVMGAPGLKPGNFPLTIGAQGTGKELMWAPLQAALGWRRATQLSQAALNGDFTGWIEHRLVLLPEMRRTTRGTLTDHDQYQVLKAMLDNGKEFLTVNRKYLAPYPVRNVFVLVMTSNEDRPITLDKDDRRIWVIRANNPGWPVARYQDLAAWYVAPTLHGGVNQDAIAEWLTRNWDPAIMEDEIAGHAPMSPAKQDLIARGRDAMETWTEELLARDPGEPLAVPTIFTIRDIMDRIERAGTHGGEGLARGTKSPGAQAIGHILSELGCRKLLNGQQILVKTRRDRLWARAVDAPGFDTMTSDQIRDMLL